METVNVNISGRCSLGNCYAVNPDGTPYSPETGGHGPGCPAAPVLIPCPLPRSVIATVRLGECICPHIHVVEHYASCPARPIRVTCSISGKTWEESEVDEFDIESGVPVSDFWGLDRACRERWALVKALVLGKNATFVRPDWVPADLFTQRDAVYAALANMARAEDAQAMAKIRAYDTMDSSGLSADSEHMRARSMPRGSTEALAAYVEHLIEQVGVLS